MKLTCMILCSLFIFVNGFNTKIEEYVLQHNTLLYNTIQSQILSSYNIQNDNNNIHVDFIYYNCKNSYDVNVNCYDLFICSTYCIKNNKIINCKDKKLCTNIINVYYTNYPLIEDFIIYVLFPIIIIALCYGSYLLNIPNKLLYFITQIKNPKRL